MKIKLVIYKMEYSDTEKQFIFDIAENVRNMDIDEYNRFDKIRQEDGIDRACDYVAKGISGKVNGFSHNKNNTYVYFAKVQTFPSRMHCHGSTWSVARQQTKRV